VILPKHQFRGMARCLVSAIFVWGIVGYGRPSDVRGSDEVVKCEFVIMLVLLNAQVRNSSGSRVGAFFTLLYVVCREYM
jgi:hypothetical protein